MSCAQCEGIDQFFDAEKARHQLEKFRRKGELRHRRAGLEAENDPGETWQQALDEIKKTATDGPGPAPPSPQGRSCRHR